MTIGELYEFNIDNLETHLNEMQAYNIILDEDNIDAYLKDVLKVAIQRKKETLNRKSESFKRWEADIIYNLKDRYVRLVMAISQKNIKLPKKERNSRDYNLLTEVSMDLIQLITDAFDKEMVEVDIVSCNPRIIYAYCGLKLPVNFYGENKKNKKKINTLLNRLSVDFPRERKICWKEYKKNRKKELVDLGFDKKVIKFLFKKFWQRDKGALFEFCSYHEMRIIEKLQNELKTLSDYGSYLRRHDSVISFRVLSEAQIGFINDFEYLNEKGWFEKINEDEKGVQIDQILKTGHFQPLLKSVAV
jgi:hypothetical protein